MIMYLCAYACLARILMRIPAPPLTGNDEELTPKELVTGTMTDTPKCEGPTQLQCELEAVGNEVLESLEWLRVANRWVHSGCFESL